MGLFKKKKKDVPAEGESAERKGDTHYHTPLDYYAQKDKDVNCPECAKARKHIKMVENEGREMECPECHYVHLARR